MHVVPVVAWELYELGDEGGVGLDDDVLHRELHTPSRLRSSVRKPHRTMYCASSAAPGPGASFLVDAR
jgi:hypothetical protein